MQLLCLAPRTEHCMSRSLVSNSSMCCLFSFCSVSLVLMLSRLEVSQFSPRILQFTFQLADCETCVPPTQQGNKKLKTPQIRVGFLHASSAQLFRPSSKLSRTGFDLKTECREMDRTRFRLYFRQTVGRHLVRFHLDKSHFWSLRSILSRKTPSAQYVSFCEWIPFLLIMLTAAEEPHHWICCHVEHVSSAFQISQPVPLLS